MKYVAAFLVAAIVPVAFLLAMGLLVSADSMALCQGMGHSFDTCFITINGN